MRKTVLTIVGAALLVASTAQIAAAAEHQKSRKLYRAPAPESQTFRDSNAYYGWPAPAQSDWSRYSGGAISAPAGH